VKSNRTQQVLALLRDYESRNVTFIEPDGSWPVVWERARGVDVWDADGRKYLDLTAAFGVAAAGHANPRVVHAGQLQMEKLLHAMGDVHPHALKARLARELSRLTFGRWRHSKSPRGKVIFCNSGFEAVEAALKTAMLATNRCGVIAFEGAYHGLGYGTLNATHRDHFRGPFLAQLGGFARFAAYPVTSGQLKQTIAQVRALLEEGGIGAILVEPVQARGGINVPPAAFLPALRRLCAEHGALLILDEIYTGFGRTGKWFACEHSRTVPDVICLGKALTGGFPLSACVGRADLMDAAWPVSGGEAIHTSTFLGHPVGCAMALAQIGEIQARGLVSRSALFGKHLLRALQSSLASSECEISIRGLGLMAGVELRLPGGVPATLVALRVIKAMLAAGFILLPEGPHANVISFTPPLTITRPQLAKTVRALARVLK
jgi:4-aminobutyrate aminotransferase-like enzyme